MTQEKTALVVDPTTQAFSHGYAVGQAGYPNVSIRRSALQTREEICKSGCRYDLVIIVDKMAHDCSPGFELLKCLRYAGFEGLIVFWGDPIICGRARAIGGEGFEWANSHEELMTFVRVSHLVAP